MRLFLLILLLLSNGCGSRREVDGPTPQPTVKPTPGGDISFQDVQAITSQFCIRCHTTSQFLKSETAWRASEAKQRVSNGSMPAAGSAEARAITAADRGVLVNF
jgi:hypothetical protein